MFKFLLGVTSAVLPLRFYPYVMQKITGYRAVLARRVVYVRGLLRESKAHNIVEKHSKKID